MVFHKDSLLSGTFVCQQCFLRSFGGFIVKHWKVHCGFGQWGSVAPLPTARTLYLQSEAIGILNTTLVCLCCILLHWFVTPGIAAVLSRKTPVKFLGWFLRFWSCILSEFAVPTADQLAPLGTVGNRPGKCSGTLPSPRAGLSRSPLLHWRSAFPPGGI